MDLGARLSRLGTIGAPRAPPPRAVDALQIPDSLFGPDSRVGREPVLPARAVRPTTLARLACDEALLGVDPGTALFLDTETTGLQHGAGTLPFLIGLAWFENDSLRVRQLFLGHPGGEAPLLAELATRIAGASMLVTFNGKSFDWPLLRTRFVLNRMAIPALPPHLDLVHGARRVFKRRPHVGRLKEVEANILGFHRHGDIDGALIPAVYFDWLRRGTRGLLDQVFAHNAQDVVSMAAIASALARRLEAPEANDAAEDLVSIAELAARHHDWEAVERFAGAACELSPAALTMTEALQLRAQAAVRRQRVQQGTEYLEAATHLSGAPAPLIAEVHLSLAKLYEHRLGDFARAAAHAASASSAEHATQAARRRERLARRQVGREPSPSA